MVCQSSSVWNKGLILSWLALSFLFAVTHAAAQSAQEQYKDQLHSIQEKLQEAQRALDEKRYDQALAVAEDGLHDSEQLPEALPRAIYGRALAQTLMGMAYSARGDHSQAIEVWRRAIALYEKLTKAENNHAVTLENMAASLQVLGDSQQAIDAYLAAADLSEKAAKYEDAARQAINAITLLSQLPRTTDSVSKLITANYDVARWQQKSGNCKDATAHFRRTLLYLDQLIGSPDIEKSNNQTLQGLAYCLETLGEVPEWVKAGEMLQELKRYSLAAEYFDKALLLYERGHSDPRQRAEYHQRIAFELSLAEDWAKAHEHLSQKLEILRNLDNTGEDQATALHDDGVALEHLSRYQEAYEAYRKALSLYDAVPGSEALRAEICFRTADIAIQLKDKAMALQIAIWSLPLYDAAKNTREYSVYQHAVTLMRIGDLLTDASRGTEAISFYQRALFLSEGLQDAAGHSTTLLSLKRAQIQWTLGVLLMAEGRAAEATPNLREGYLQYQKVQLSELPSLDSDQREDFFAYSAFMARYLYRLGFQQPEQFAFLGLQATLTAKSLECEVSRAESRVRLEYFNGANSSEITHLKQLRQLVARLVLLQTSEYITEVDPDGQILEKVATEAQQLEISLRKKASATWSSKSVTTPEVADLKGKLRDGDIVLEYVAFSPEPANSPGILSGFLTPLTAASDATRRSTTEAIQVTVSNAEFYKGDVGLNGVKPEAQDSEHYGVFVLTAQDGKLIALDLGRRSLIDEPILEYRRAYEAQVDPNRFRLDEGELKAQALKVKRLLLDSILKALPKPEPLTRKAQRLYIVPTGMISLLPFETLPQEHAGSGWHYLVEDYELVYLSSTRALFAESRTSSSSDAWLVGDPDFDASSVQDDELNAKKLQRPRKQYQDSIPNSWLSLSGTADLMSLIEQRARSLRMQSTVLRGAKASEAALSDLRSPRILVFATHGYFMADTVPVSRLHFSIQAHQTKGTPEFLASMDPMMRSMLVLAGANERYHPLQRGTPKPGTIAPLRKASTHQIPEDSPYEAEDGLLTAYEARDIDLRNTDLVALIGCESSVGAVPRTNWHFAAQTIMSAGMGMQVASGSGGNIVDTLPRLGDDGLTGLPSAFFIAGAHSIVSSAWTIPVRESAELIDEFLETWLHHNQGRNRYAAFHSAQLSALKRAREKGDTHPFRWAGLMYVGWPDDVRNAP
jgi:tetratricopeptide (TPR) repeat protein